jgi:MFS transporter, DHA1 family, multidrug resistance protein
MILGTAAIGSLGVFSLHALLPALPAIRESLASNDSTVQLLISLGMVAIALGNLVVAPLSDKFGRRPVTLGALSLYLAGSTVAIFAGRIEVLVVARIAQAFGGGAAMSVARATVTDYFGAGGGAATAMAYSAMTVLLVPMVAPTIGGIAVELASWRAVFVMSVILGMVVVAVTLRGIRETHAPVSDRRARPGSLRSYGQLLTTPDYLARAACCAALMGTVYTFIAGAPYVAIQLMGVRPSTYGLLFMLPACASFLGFLVAARVSRRIGTLGMVRLGVAGSFLGVASIAVLMALGAWQPLALFLPGMLLTFSNAVAVPSAMASAIAVRPDIAGAASGLTGFLQLGLAAVATQAVATLADQTPFPLVATMVVANACAIIAFVLVTALERRRDRLHDRRTDA